MGGPVAETMPNPGALLSRFSVKGIICDTCDQP
jgi:hypothetical protein